MSTNPYANQTIKQVEDQPTDYDGKIPERNLLAAIMQRAVTDYLDVKGEQARDWERHAYRWIMSDRESKEDFSFVYCCKHLDLDYETLRNIILTMKVDGTVWNDGKVSRVRYTPKRIRV